MNMDFSDIKVLLVGDFMMDHYIMGTSNRISPEAPVPVVTPKEEYSIPGGAGNVAMNLRAMGANIACLGAVGNDVWGEKLISILKNEGINVESIDIIKNHPTTLKQRIYSNGKQVARLDTEKIIDWTPNKIEDIDYTKYDLVIVSDYNKGTLNNGWFNFEDHNNVIVDPKKNDFEFYSNANIITPNLNELQRVTNFKITNNKSLIDACNILIYKYNFDYVVAKEGSKGMTIVGKNDFSKKIEPHSVNNPDVTGAGDTVISALSLSFILTNDIIQSAKIANLAASIVVGKPGTSIINIKELNIETIND
ncbi:PfkB family carbohydrate kinase [Candidatus Marinimicrobia bacterium]|nr:PfkB family carbohydrate kinase [Candidatus Neomarinimicrobiota bacterium]